MRPRPPRPLRYRDNRANPKAWAQRLRVSREAVDLYLSSDVVDTHCCSYMWTRFLGYDLSRRHTPHLRGTPFFNQVDFPRAREGAMTGMVWDITTFPFRGARARHDAFQRALERMLGFIRRHPDELEVVRGVSDYRAAKARGKLACWISVQGGNALDHSLESLDVPGDVVSRITLVHFTKSKIGLSNTDLLRRGAGLSAFGKRYVEKMHERRILVDLSHINPAGFYDALDVLPADAPVAVTHTGLKALRDVSRNIDDDQLRAVAARGGVIGIIYQASFIRATLYDYGIEDVLDHMEHVLAIVGEDHLILGSDYDGLVILPRDMADITEQPRLVEGMLRRGWSPERVRKVLGENYLRVLARLRP